MKHLLHVIALVVLVAYDIVAQSITGTPSATSIRYHDIRDLLIDSVRTIHKHNDTIFVTAKGKSFFVVGHRNTNKSGVYYMEGDHIFDSSRVFFIDAFPKKFLYTTLAYDKKKSIFGWNGWSYPSAFTFYSGEVNRNTSYVGKHTETINGQPVFYRTGADLVHCISKGFTSFNADTVNKVLMNKVLYSDLNSYIHYDTISKVIPTSKSIERKTTKLRK